MRRIAGTGIMLLGLVGCQSLPSVVRIEIDDSTLEFRKKVPPPDEVEAPEGEADAPQR